MMPCEVSSPRARVIGDLFCFSATPLLTTALHQVREESPSDPLQSGNIQSRYITLRPQDARQRNMAGMKSRVTLAANENSVLVTLRQKASAHSLADDVVLFGRLIGAADWTDGRLTFPPCFGGSAKASPKGRFLHRLFELSRVHSSGSPSTIRVEKSANLGFTQRWSTTHQKCSWPSRSSRGMARVIDCPLSV